MDTHKREPIRDLTLEAALAALGTGTTPADDKRRFDLYVEATQQAEAQGHFMPDLPDAIYDAVTRTLNAEFSDPPYRGLQIPPEVTAACGRRDVCQHIAGGNMVGAGQVASIYTLTLQLAQ